MLKKQSNYRTASFALFGVLLLLILLTFRQYGISWDEGVHDKIGTEIWNYYLSLLRGRADRRILSLGNSVAYGGIFNLIVGAIQRFSPLDRFETRHFVNALAGVLGIVGCWKTTRLVAGEKAAFWSALLLAIIPGYYGHMFFNPKDIPFAAGYIWSLYYILQAIREYPDLSRATLLKLSLATGLTMGVRIGGVMLMGYFVLALVLETALGWRNRSGRDPFSRSEPGLRFWSGLARRVLLPVLLAGIISYAIMLAFWPWAQQNPLANPLQALTAQQQFDYKDEVLYRGISYRGSDLPVDYIPGYLLVTTPEAVLILLAAGLALAGVRLSRDRGWLQNPSFLLKSSFLLLFSILFPVLLVIVQGSVLYDGVRHFLFILPPAACLAGISFRTLNDRLRSNWKWAPAILSLLVAGLIGLQIYTMAQLHPYEYVYYNSLAGGLKGAYLNYETDYWGLSTSEAARWLSEYVKDRSPAGGRAFPVYTCAGNASAAHYFSDRLSLVDAPERAHYGILITRWGCDREVQGETLFEVQRFGVPLAVVKELY